MAFLSRKTIQRRKKMRVAQRPGRFLQRRVILLGPTNDRATALQRNVYFVAFLSSAAASAFLISVDVPLSSAPR
jgi:hypothetical protein